MVCSLGFPKKMTVLDSDDVISKRHKLSTKQSYQRLESTITRSKSNKRKNTDAPAASSKKPNLENDSMLNGYRNNDHRYRNYKCFRLNILFLYSSVFVCNFFYCCFFQGWRGHPPVSRGDVSQHGKHLLPK